MSNIKRNYPLAPLTTLKIGGPAEFFLETKSNDELVELLKNTPKTTPITILGNSSNVLVSDSGIHGLVIRNLSKNITIHHANQSISQDTPVFETSTHRTENEPEKYLDFASLDYDESDRPRIKVTLDAGTPLPLAINYLISQGITGLQWFAYIPGTIGGATWYNIHGGKYNLSTYIDSVKIFDLTSGEIMNLTKGEDNVFDYETSPFQLHPDWIILSTTLNLYLGDSQKAAAVVKAWIAQKSKVQPMNSAGSTFQNPTLEDSVRNWGEQKSTGWIIDHELGWKGKSLGGAQISLQHANFIVNTSSATATDYLTLANLIIDEVQKRFGFKLKLEIKLLGNFD